MKNVLFIFICISQLLFSCTPDEEVTQQIQDHADSNNYTLVVEVVPDFTTADIDSFSIGSLFMTSVYGYDSTWTKQNTLSESYPILWSISLYSWYESNIEDFDTTLVDLSGENPMFVIKGNDLDSLTRGELQYISDKDFHIVIRVYSEQRDVTGPSSEIWNNLLSVNDEYANFGFDNTPSFEVFRMDAPKTPGNDKAKINFQYDHIQKSILISTDGWILNNDSTAYDPAFNEIQLSLSDFIN